MDRIFKVKELGGSTNAIDVYKNTIYIDDENGEHKFEISQVYDIKIQRKGSLIFNLLSKYYPSLNSWIDGSLFIAFRIKQDNERSKVETFGFLIRYDQAVELERIIWELKKNNK